MSNNLEQFDTLLRQLAETILHEAGGYLKNAPRKVQKAVFAKANNRMGPNATQAGLEKGVECSPYWQKFRQKQASEKGFIAPPATTTLRRLKAQGDLGPAVRSSEVKKRAKCGEAPPLKSDKKDSGKKASKKPPAKKAARLKKKS